MDCMKNNNLGIINIFWCRIHLWFHLMGGLQAKSMTSQRNRATYKMADMCYYGNVTTTTRWRLYVTMETLWQQQDGGYALLWKRYPNIQITSTFAVEDLYTELVIDVFYIFNSTVIDWTCYFLYMLHKNVINGRDYFRKLLNRLIRSLFPLSWNWIFSYNIN